MAASRCPVHEDFDPLSPEFLADPYAVLAALRKVAPGIAPDAKVAVLFPDSASRYLSTIFNDDWMREKGMLG